MCTVCTYILFLCAGIFYGSQNIKLLLLPAHAKNVPLPRDCGFVFPLAQEKSASGPRLRNQLINLLGLHLLGIKPELLVTVGELEFLVGAGNTCTT